MTLEDQQYEALLRAASGDDDVDVDSLQASIDAANGIQRYVLRVQWVDVTGQRPEINLWDWPPSRHYVIRKTRPITEDDVVEVLDNNAVNPAVVYVTEDPEGKLGLTLLENWNF